MIIGVATGVLLFARSLIDRSPTAAGLAALMLIASAAIALITASKGGLIGTEVAKFAGFALIMATGPLALMVIAELVRMPAYVPRMWGLALAILIGGSIQTARLGGDPIIYAVPAQAGFVLFGWTRFAHSAVPDRRSRAFRQRLAAGALLIALTLATVAMMIRLLFTEIEALRLIVPVTLSLQFVVLLVVSLWMLLKRSTAIFSNADSMRAADPQLVQLAEQELLQGAARLPDLDADMLALRLGVSSTRLTAALSASAWGSFPAILQSSRLRFVQDMLGDDAERETSIEAIGLLAGFRSRSVLYEAFHKQFGMNPGQYRQKLVRKSPPDRKEGCQTEPN